MKKNIRPIGACVLLAVLAAGIVSCGEGTGKPEDTKKTGEGEESAIRNLSDVPDDLDFGDAPFRILYRETAKTVFIEKSTGDIIEDAVYKRNLAAEEALNVHFVDSKSATCDLEELQTAVLADDKAYDAAMTHISRMAEFAQNGYLVGLDEVQYLDLDKPYWAKGATEGLRVGGKDYLFSGDICIVDDANIWCIYFNKALISQLELESPYVALKAGKWTLDYFAASAKEGASDLNGDGVWTWYDDRFALLNPTETLCGMYNTMGQRAVTLDGDGKMQCTLNSDKSIEVLSKISEWASSGQNTIFLEASQIQTEDPWTDLRGVFVAGRALYYLHTINMTGYGDMRNMEQEYGILPMPKYDEEQKDYMSSTQEWGQVIYGIPTCAPDFDMSGAVLETMGALSTDTLRSAYYDQALTRKYTSDKESVETLDILFNKITVDIGFSYFWKIRYDINQALASSGGQIMSTIDSMIPSLNDQIETTENAFAELG